MTTFSPEIKLLLGRVTERKKEGEVLLERLRRPEAEAEGWEEEEAEDSEEEIEVIVERVSMAELAERKLVT